MGRSKAVPDFVLRQCTAADRTVDQDVRPILLRRADHLPEPYRTLVQSVLQGSHSFRQLAVLADRSPGHLCRLVRQIVLRLRDPIVTALMDFPPDLSERDRQIALRHFAVGQSARSIARQTGLHYEHVLSILAYVRGWARVSARLVKTARHFHEHTEEGTQHQSLAC